MSTSHIIETFGYGVSVEAIDGLEIHGKSRAARGEARLPSLGVEDYAYSCAQRLSGTQGKGPFGAPKREPTAAEVAILRAAVRDHLRAIDAGHAAEVPS